jgi:predicted ATPase/DNA-binding SARP family transcriptional activator
VPPDHAVPAAAGAAEGAALPADLTRLVGRQREVAEVRQLLASSRLVTLTGSGGSGKTRLALAVTAEVAPSVDGVRWVEMGALAEPHLVAQHVAAACGVGEGAAGPQELLVAALAPSRLLLVLDNCEHLVEACAVLVDLLLRSCGRLTVLATSREPLGIAGEQAWLVPPLGLPPEGDAVSVDEALQAAAVELFVERARAARPGFVLADGDAAAVAQICRRLDGLPLALELAAARIKVLAPRDLAKRLDDAFSLLTGGARTAPARHRTLRATLDWSYRLLAEPERAVLRRLSVFAGSFDLAAAEAVAAGEAVEKCAVLDLVAALVDRSLVAVEACCGEARYRLLETVRQYAAERLREAGEREVAARRHARHFLALAEEAEPSIFGGDGDAPWMLRLDQDAADLRVAFEHCAADPEGATMALRLAYALHWHWFARGHFREARERLAAAVVAVGDEVDPELRARGLAALARAALWQGDGEAVLQAAERAVALLPPDADPIIRSYVINALGVAQSLAGDHTAAVRSFTASAEAAETHPVMLTIACSWRGQSELALGDLDSARASLERALELGRRDDHRPAIGHPLSLLGCVHELAGDEAAARRCWVEALAVLLSVDDGWGLQQALEGMARLAASGGDPARAVRLFASAAAARHGLGSLLPPDEELGHRRALEKARQELGEEGFAADWEAGRRLSRPEAVALALGDAAVDTEDGCCGPPTLLEITVPAGARSAAAATAAGAARAPAEVEVRALGSFEVWRDGARLDGDTWGASKPRELLLFLLAHPRGAGREQVGLALWPDASPGQLRNSFHVTLHRLRRGLGDGDLITVSGDRYAAAPALLSRFDARRFEEAATAALGAVDAAGDTDNLEAALALYRGELLAGEALADWALELRERLASLHRRLLRAHGGALLAAGRAAEAVEVFNALLDGDGLDEEACRQLMLCHTRLHRRSEALRLYHRLAERLRAELDALPDPVTTDLFERLQTGGRP